VVVDQPAGHIELVRHVGDACVREPALDDDLAGGFEDLTASFVDAGTRHLLNATS
jgi:hypothetical protein